MDMDMDMNMNVLEPVTSVEAEDGPRVEDDIVQVLSPKILSSGRQGLLG
jgi:hypothetical protein